MRTVCKKYIFIQNIPLLVKILLEYNYKLNKTRLFLKIITQLNGLVLNIVCVCNVNTLYENLKYKYFIKKF